MNKPILYLFIGAPGAGKTTVAKLIAERTGAGHLWADAERHKMFPEPTHSEQESLQLYDYLNQRAADLLAQGRSVAFDTNFNFYEDRRKLREVAEAAGAETVVIWMTTPEAVARQRSVHAPLMRNGYLYGMTEDQFNAIVAKLELPHKDEKIIKFNGEKLDNDEVVALLSL